MKKLLTTFLSVLACLTISACLNPGPAEQSAETQSSVASNPEESSEEVETSESVSPETSEEESSVKDSTNYVPPNPEETSTEMATEGKPFDKATRLRYRKGSETFKLKLAA